MGMGTALAPARRFDRAERLKLRRRLTGRQLAFEMEALMEETCGTPRGGARGRLSSVHRMVLSAVDRALREEGGDRRSAVATVLERYTEGLRLIDASGSRTGLDALSETAEVMLEQLVKAGSPGRPVASSYVAVADRLGLAEAILLPPGLAGAVLVGGDPHQLATVGRLLQVPIVTHVPQAMALIPEGCPVRVDAGTGRIVIGAKSPRRLRQHVS